MIERCTKKEVELILLRGIEYFEMKVISLKKIIAIGIATKNMLKDNFVGWDKNTIGYHSDDGTIREEDESTGNVMVEAYYEGDTVGLGIDWDRKAKFVTKNGKILDVRQQNLAMQVYYAVVSMQIGDVAQVNFGETNFVFDIQQYVENPYQFSSFSWIKNTKKRARNDIGIRFIKA
eukprot:TRINITY_DN12066_c0_g1_i1.p1 TRINITY_DN12066_c0_g1~~TRINITY_DN12066_c0_g1_i1.p1  ORF type:complete len:176 (+),score=53.48 TRINITY_DN12066_c0_g1_i1:331-858(+)